MQTLKITKKKTETVEQEVELQLPYFCRHENYYYCVVSDKIAYEILFDKANPERYSFHDIKDVGYFMTNIQSAVQITKEEFELAYNGYLESVNRFYYKYLDSCNAILEESQA